MKKTWMALALCGVTVFGIALESYAATARARSMPPVVCSVSASNSPTVRLAYRLA